MATLNKILGRRKPVQTTTEILYTVPSSTQANINLFCSNQIRMVLFQRNDSLQEVLLYQSLIFLFL